jgi:hypothetical protein
MCACVWKCVVCVGVRAWEQVASGIELLDPLTGEPNAAAYGLMALSLLLPLVLASEAVSSIVAALQALAGLGCARCAPLFVDRACVLCQHRRRGSWQRKERSKSKPPPTPCHLATSMPQWTRAHTHTHTRRLIHATLPHLGFREAGRAHFIRSRGLFAPTLVLRILISCRKYSEGRQEFPRSVQGYRE